MSKQKKQKKCVRTGKSINNLLSYCGLVDARIRASEKDLPVSSVDLSKSAKL